MIVVDTHLHYYDFYDAELFVHSLMANLEAIAPGADGAGIILDRAGLDGFRIFCEKLEAMVGAEVSVSESLARYQDDRGSVAVYRGVQVACAEGFEVLGLFCSEQLAVRLSAEEAIKRIVDAGGIPVVAWAPGKWLLKRRELVRRVLEKIDVGVVCLGDTALRPTFWGEPKLMREFRDSGSKVLYGSDPLPFSGQEAVSGSFATLLSGTLGDGDLPDLLRAREVEVCSTGRRAGALSFFTSMLRNQLAR